MPLVSVVLPVFNVEKFVAQAIDSVLAQSFEDFELLIVNDVSPDGSRDICATYTDPRIRIIDHKENRGLAGARNTGIRESAGQYVALLDSDDFWHPEKLEQHVAHLNSNPEIGVSFSRSAFVSESGEKLQMQQMPRLQGITTKTLMCRNPIGNGSAPVVRHEVFKEISYIANIHGGEEEFYFDEKFRQSEDIECWIRIIITTDWKIEGLSKSLTYYRLNPSSLSANTEKQLASWEAVIKKTEGYAPHVVERWGSLARAYQYRYLARQTLRTADGNQALGLSLKAIRIDHRILVEEPTRTILTVVAALYKRAVPAMLGKQIEPIGFALIGFTQNLRIKLAGHPTS